MPPLNPPAASGLTDEEIVSIAIDSGYAVPENERHLAFGRAVVCALLAKAAPSPSAPTRQPDGGYPGCDACACKPGSCYINAMLAPPNAQEPVTRAMLDLASAPLGNNARAVCAVAGIDPTKPFNAPSPSESTSAPWGYAIDVSGYKRLLDETAGAAEKQAAHFHGRGHAVTVTPLGPIGASPAEQGEEAREVVWVREADALRATLCAVGIVGQIDGQEVIRLESAIDLVDRLRAAVAMQEGT